MQHFLTFYLLQTNTTCATLGTDDRSHEIVIQTSCSDKMISPAQKSGPD